MSGWMLLECLTYTNNKFIGTIYRYIYVFFIDEKMQLCAKYGFWSYPVLSSRLLEWRWIFDFKTVIWLISLSLLWFPFKIGIFELFDRGLNVGMGFVLSCLCFIGFFYFLYILLCALTVRLCFTYLGMGKFIDNRQ